LARFTKVQDFLLFFYDATLVTEGSSATIDKVLPTMDFLLEQFETAKCTYVNDPFMSPCCNSGWAKLNKYYSLITSLRLSLALYDIILCKKNLSRVKCIN
jgi:hypothetical protein